MESYSLAVTREVDEASLSSAPSAEVKSERTFQSLIV